MLATYGSVVSGSGKCENLCARTHRANASARRNSEADGTGGPCKFRAGGFSFAQAFWAAWNAGKAGLGSLPLEPGSGKLGTPLARMQPAYFTACVSTGPELLGLEVEPHAASPMAETANAASRRTARMTRSIMRPDV